MVDITTIPLEILHNIIEYLNILDNKGTQLLRYYQSYHRPAHLGITFDKYNPDISLFDAMRVCKSWRNMIFQQIFKEDVTKWSPERWQEEIDRFRTVERLALIEMTRVCVTLWQKTLVDASVPRGEQSTGSTNVPVRAENQVNGEEAAADSTVGPSESAGHA